MHVHSQQQKHKKNTWNLFKLTTKISKQCHWSRPGAFIVDFEHISRPFLLFLLLTLNKQIFAGFSVFRHGKVRFPYNILLKTRKSEKRQHPMKKYPYPSNEKSLTVNCMFQYWHRPDLRRKNIEDQPFQLVLLYACLQKLVRSANFTNILSCSMLKYFKLPEKLGLTEIQRNLGNLFTSN